jgi:hypothetical protein
MKSFKIFLVENIVKGNSVVINCDCDLGKAKIVHCIEVHVVIGIACMLFPGTFRSAVPSGASTGIYEALELRDKDPSAYHGKGTL